MGVFRYRVKLRASLGHIWEISMAKYSRLWPYLFPCRQNEQKCLFLLGSPVVDELPANVANVHRIGIVAAYTIGYLVGGQ